MHGLKQLVVKSPVTKRLVTSRMVESIDTANPPDDFKKGKFIIFVGGGKGSGKSTLLDTLFQELADEGYDRRYIAKIGSYAFAPILEAPLIRNIRPHLNKQAKNLAHNPDQPSMGSQLVDEALQTALRQESPIVVDYHMDDEKYVDKVMASAKAHGYESILIAPHISAENYFARVSARQHSTGRPFNPLSGLQSHKGFAQRMDCYTKQFDLSIFLSNDKDFSPPTPIAIATPHSMEIYDEQAFQAMRRKASLNVHARTASELYPEQSADITDKTLRHPSECLEHIPSDAIHNQHHGEFVDRLMQRLFDSTHPVGRG